VANTNVGSLASLCF